MFNFPLFLAQAGDAGADAVSDGIATGNVALIVAGGVAVAAPVALKAFGIKVPGLDPLLEFALGMVRRLGAKQADPAKRDADLKKIAQKVKAEVEKGQ
jgi:hypothetical protein